jgi:hypothetical protein
MKSNCIFAFALFLVIGTISRADVIISSGYYDLSPAQSGGGPALPNPWYGSANTTFYGSASDISAATSSDPDISGLLFQNTGSTSVTLSALGLSGGLNVLGRGGVTSVTLAPGQFYIFAVGDGSDDGLSLQTISATLNGTAYSFADATTALAPDGVLFGDSPQLGGGDETQPWTQDADLLHSGSTSPEPASYILLLAAFPPVLWAARRHAGGRSTK